MLSLFGPFTRSLIGLLTYPAYRAFLAATRRPELARQSVWTEIAPLLRRSEFWRERFRPRLEDYEVTTLEFYQKALEQNRDGDTSPLNQERVLFWSQSAGTTGNRKLFPMTPSFRRQFQRTVPPLVHGLIKRYPRFLECPALYFAATDPQERTAAGLEIGFISNYNYRTIPSLMRSQYAFPRELFRDSATFDRYAAVYALQGDVSAMFAVTPMSFKRLISAIRDNRDFILGCLRGDVPWDATLPKPAVTRQRLETVSRLLNADQLSFRQLWPSLDCVCSWKTAVCAAQLREISPYLQGVDVIDAIYSATEGWVTVPVVEYGGNVVHPGAHIVEFIEAGREVAARNLLQLWELKVGGRYEVFLTTAMGLVRYRLCDVIACTGYYNQAPVIEFAHKSTGIISLGLVSIAESELVESLLAAGVALRSHWRVGPNASGNGLVLYADAGGNDLEVQLAAADEHLRALNVNYRIYRGNQTIVPLTRALLPLAHPLWTQTSVHAQSKPMLLLQVCPE
jgi:hypothetical protein